MATAVQFTLRSRNSKVGPIPVSTTSANTCPHACPLRKAPDGKDGPCYAKFGPLGGLWAALNKAVPGKTYKRGKNILQSLTWAQFVSAVAALPEGTLWRHNQAGDLPGNGNKIDRVAFTDLVIANMGRRGWTYTHKPMNADNASCVGFANRNGFTVNLSADNLREADELSDLGIAPVVVVLPETVHGNVPIETPAGRKVAVCPATYRDEVSCASCQLCQRQERKVIIGFPAHGASKRKASAIAVQS